MGEGLLRQRRNLITACVLLWFMKYAGITFTKISITGFDIAFANPVAVTTAIWISFTYFLYRYYQYFSDEGVLKLSRVFEDALENNCRPIIQELVINFPTTFGGNYSYRSLKTNGWMYQWNKMEQYDTSTGTVNSTNMEDKITRWMLRKGIFNAYADSIFRNSVVTDYLLPFALAGWVIYYCGSDDWQGSFIRLWFDA
ncbi:MAG: hypothetical protein PHP70_08935 [Gallionella sp.]|nr:hypothetical protein [Gallionella sp.]